MLVPIRARYRVCTSGYSIVAADSSPAAERLICERSTKVEWRTLDSNEADVAVAIASISPTDDDSVLDFARHWGLPQISVTDDKDRGCLPVATLAKAVRRLREGIAAASAGDLEVVSDLFDKHARIDASLKYDHTPLANEASLYLECANLVSLAWCQLTQHSNSHAEHRACGWCGTLFTVAGPEGHRRSRQYCSDRCRVAANRAKKREPGAVSNPR